jgi:hypothetical protein
LSRATGAEIAQLHLRLCPSNGDGTAQLGLVLRHKLQGLAEQGHGLALRPPLGSMLRCQLQKPNCLVDVAGLPPVVGQQGGGLLDPLAGRRLDEPGYRGVPLPSGGPGKRGVGHLPDEHVFEQVFVVALDLAPRLPTDEVAGLQHV